MRIGIGIDNVISDFNAVLLKAYLKHDRELRNTGIINENAEDIRKDMFDWTKEEEETFYQENIKRVLKQLKPISHSQDNIKKLREEGNEIYIISARLNRDHMNPEKETKEWLEKYKIPYDRLILTKPYEKGIACKENNIEIMIDDSVKNCMEIASYGVKVWIMNTRYNQKATQFERVYGWSDIYTKISAIYKKIPKRINVILDTDTYNECDDQFALAYLLKSQDRFHIEAITIAPYSHSNGISIIEGQEKSYEEVLKICKWLEFDAKGRVYKGSEDYITEGYQRTNDAVEKIIKVANQNEKTYIIGIGAITNIALALKKDKKIKEKIEVVWLGGNGLACLGNKEEYNFRQDVEAVKMVLGSGVKLTVIPCKSVASDLVMSIQELKEHLKDRNEMCTYLYNRFHNDGVHGNKLKRRIWDISAIAYLINKNWFETREISCPMIKEDMRYEFTKDRHKVTFATYLEGEKIYNDMFKKLTK